MLHPSTKMLINKLSEMTRKQRVEWDEAENGQIIHDTEGYRVILTPAPHSVMLTDVLGKEIETCTPEEIAAEADTDGRPYSQFVSELYREASRHARGTERAIDAVLRGLDREDENDALETIEEHDAPTIQLDESEAIEDLTDESDPSDFDPLPVSADDVDDASEEIEGETEMTRAIEAMAEEVNGHEPEATTLLEESAPTEDTPVFEAAIEPEAEVQYEATADTLIDDISPEIESDILNEESILETDDTETQLPPLYTATEGPADAPAPVIEIDADPKTNPAPAASRIAPMGGTAGFFGSSLGDLSRYRTQQMTDRIAEEEKSTPIQSEESNSSSDDVVAEMASPSYTPPEFDDPIAPELDAAPETPPEAEEAEPAPRKFSLSGLTSGFGMGTPANVTPAEEAAQPNETPAETPKMIDGTIDLPDYPPAEPVAEETVSPVLPSFDQPLASQSVEADEDSGKEWIVREEEASPVQTDVEPEETEPKIKKPTPFNPWN